MKGVLTDMAETEKPLEVLIILTRHGISANGIRTNMMTAMVDNAKSKDLPKEDRSRYDACAKDLNLLGLDWLNG